MTFSKAPVAAVIFAAVLATACGKSKATDNDGVGPVPQTPGSGSGSGSGDTTQATPTTTQPPPIVTPPPQPIVEAPVTPAPAVPVLTTDPLKIVAMRLQADGNYAVECGDGRAETRSLLDVQDGAACMPVSAPATFRTTKFDTLTSARTLDSCWNNTTRCGQASSTLTLDDFPFVAEGTLSYKDLRAQFSGVASLSVTGLSSLADGATDEICTYGECAGAHAGLRFPLQIDILASGPQYGDTASIGLVEPVVSVTRFKPVAKLWEGTVRLTGPANATVIGAETTGLAVSFDVETTSYDNFLANGPGCNYLTIEDANGKVEAIAAGRAPFRFDGVAPVRVVSRGCEARKANPENATADFKLRLTRAMFRGVAGS